MTTRGTSSPRATRSSRASKRVGSLSLLALCLLLAAGCGDSETSTDASTEATRSIPALPPAEAEERPAVGDGEGGVELTEIGSFDDPVHLSQPPGGGEDLYVVEQGGTIQRVGPDGETDTFLDISDEVTAGGEQGLLSVAFSPDYASSGRFYVYFTNTSGDSTIREYTVADGEADPESARDVMHVDQPFANHNGGLLLFGPDGHLYIGLGDGGGADDPDRRALDLGDPLGKILRIDPRPDGARPYSIPAANPFAGTDGARGEIYSYGLRNPGRFSFDRLTGALSIGDVGQEEQEEIDLVAKGEGRGANFGWSAFEGEARFNEDQEAPGAVPPVHVATQADGNC